MLEPLYILLADGRALAGPDYVPIERQRVRWSSNAVEPRTGANDPPFEITIADDDDEEDIIEYLEVFFTVDTVGFASPDAVARITILDNDGRKLGMEGEREEEREGGRDV